MPRAIASVLTALVLGCTGTRALPGAAHGTPPPPSLAPATPDGDWVAYGRTSLGDRYSPLAEIRRENVASLELAWRHHTGELAPAFATARRTAMEATPLVVGGTMYVSTPLGRVLALDPASGAERWVFDPKLDRSRPYG